MEGPRGKGGEHEGAVAALTLRLALCVLTRHVWRETLMLPHLRAAAQRREATHPRSHSLEVAELGFEPRWSGFATITLQEREGEERNWGEKE